MIKLKDRICRSHGFYSLGVESMLLEFLNDVNRWACHVSQIHCFISYLQYGSSP